MVSGTIYVLRSRSDDPFIAANRDLVHKIGVTGGDVKARIAGAEKEPTYLLADVEVVREYRLSGINPRKLEALFHRLFAAARLDLALPDRWGAAARPREWFIVPLSAIDQAVERILDGSIVRYVYNRTTAALAPAPRPDT